MPPDQGTGDPPPFTFLLKGDPQAMEGMSQAGWCTQWGVGSDPSSPERVAIACSHMADAFGVVRLPSAGVGSSAGTATRWSTGDTLNVD